ncbi:hypothetical protein GMOD_00008848 [Pyrenophora seminiperda CCB06]|uniref:BTB domain-containing protein n=1 Tax=Pyrenophora seminiperda CCB06 TaxID=1302712 RepID=A0A3M7M693_9PLEO|nr:hypothetical protein GMOD_00008848 [Pyrenophora seminiperda CCB06]
MTNKATRTFKHRYSRAKSDNNSHTATAHVQQVRKVLTDIKEDRSYHLGAWEPLERKELSPDVTIKLELLHNQSYVSITVPKLAFIAASPVFAEHIAECPNAQNVRLINKAVDLEAVKTIADWLRKICSDEVYTDLPIPRDLEQALQLRRTARTLGMSQYVAAIIENYICALGSRVPDASELVLVSEYTRDYGIVDPMLEALANWVGYLMKYHQVDAKMARLYARELKAEKCQRLLDAVCERKVDMIHELGWLAVYRKPWS